MPRSPSSPPLPSRAGGAWLRPERLWGLLREAPAWVFPLALTFALLVVIGPLSGLFEAARPLASFRDRAIGMTTLAGVDASPYAHVYVRAAASGLAIFLAAALALAGLGQGLRRRLAGLGPVPELRAIPLLAAFAAALTALRLVADDALTPTFVGLLLALIAALFGLALLRDALSRRGGSRGLAIGLGEVVSGGGRTLLGLALLPFPIVFLVQLVAGRTLGFTAAPLAAWLGLWAGWLALFFAVHGVWLSRRLGPDASPEDLAAAARRGHFRILLAGVPVMLIPGAIPLANEIQVRLPGRDPRSLALGAAGFLLAAGVGLFFAGPALARRLGYRLDGGAGARRLVERFYLPALVGTWAVFKFHQHTHHFAELDYFHYGEITLPTEQLAHFGRLPLVDIRLSHTFSDMLLQGLYTLVMGYRGLDMLLWFLWMPAVVAALVSYLLLARLATPGFALLAVLLLPIPVSPYYAPAFLVTLCLGAVLRRPGWHRWLLVWLSLIAVGLWRIDFGLGSAVAVGVVLVPWLLGGTRPGTGRGLGARLMPMLAGLAIAGGGALAGLFGLTLASGRPVFSTLAALVRSYSFRLSTRTRPVIIRDFDLLAALQYYLLPAVGLTVLGIVAVRFLGGRLSRGRRPGLQALLFAQVAAFSLILSVRSLERHSLLEDFNPYVFLFLGATLPFLLLGRRSRRAAAMAVALLAAVSLLGLPPLSLPGRNIYLVRAAAPGPIFRFHPWEEGERRVFYDLGRQEAVIQFLDQNLGPGETFFDFTNSPLLYVFTERLFPTWTIPNLIQTSEAIQKQVVGEIEALRGAGRLPFVLFKQGSRFWDATDGVPNEIRSYRVAEAIYRHYEPYITVGGYQVWREKSRGEEEEMAGEIFPLAWSPERSVLRMIPIEIAEDQNPEEDPGQEQPADDGWISLRAIGADPQLRDRLDLTGIPWERHRFWNLLFDVHSDRPGGLQVYYSYDEQVFDGGRTQWLQITGEGRQQGAVLLPRPPGAVAPEVLNLRFDPPPQGPIAIGHLRLRGSARSLVPLDPEGLTQHFDLRQLPRIWAHHDPLAALSRTPEIASFDGLLGEGGRLEAREVLRLPLEGEAARAGYLHLRLRTPVLLDDTGLGIASGTRRGFAPVRMTVRYGPGAAVNTFRFDLLREPVSSLERHVLPLLAGGKLKAMEWIAQGGSARYRATGPDPSVRGILDLSGVPEAPEAEGQSDVFLVLELEPSESLVARGEPLQIFWAFGQSYFNEARSFQARLYAPARRQLLLVPMGPKAPGARLTDVRIDPPEGSSFELFAAYLLRRPVRYEDYLVRLPTQWHWFQGGQEELVIEASGPVEIEAIRLRGGD